MSNIRKRKPRLDVSERIGLCIILMLAVIGGLPGCQASSGVCYLGEPLWTPGGNQEAPIDLQRCNQTDGSVISGRALYLEEQFWYIRDSRRRVDISGNSTARSAMLYLLQVGEVPSPAFVAMLNLSFPELVCGSCICALCGNGTNGTGAGPNGTVIYQNPNVTLTPSLYRGGPWFPYPNGSLPLDTPAGWNISNTDENLSEYCKMPASPKITDPDSIVLGLNNLSICGGCVRLRTIPNFNNIHSGDPCIDIGFSQSWDRQTPHLWTEPNPVYLNCSIYPQYKWTSAGWFDGYSSEAICVARTNSLPFGCLPVGTGYYATDRWCPSSSMTIDPVLCYRANAFSRQCTNQFYAGQQTNGDDLFCAQYGCNTNSQCICRFMDVMDIEEHFVNGTWQSGTSITVALGVETEESNRIRPRMPSSPLEEEPMFLSIFDDVIKIVFSSADDRTISLSKPGMADWFHCQTRVCTRDLQDATYLSSGFLKVVSISASNKTAVGETWVVGRTSCYRYDCNWCMEDIQNFHCLDTSYQVTLVLGIIALGLLSIVLMIVLLMWASWFIMWMTRKFAGCFFSTPLGDNTSAGVRNFVNLFTPRAGTAMVILMMFCICADACDTSYVQTTNLSSCTQNVNGLVEDCTMSIDIQLTLPYLGSTACIVLQDQNGKEVTNLEIFYKTAVREVDYALQYFTSSFETFTEQKIRCSGRYFNSGCSKSKCRSGNVSRTGEDNLVNPLVYMYPGETFCNMVFESSLLDPLPACAFNEDCLYNAYGIVPRGVVYSVSKPVRERIVSTVVLSVVTSTGPTVAELELGSNPTVFFGDYTATLTISGDGERLTLDSLSLVASVSEDAPFKAYLSSTSAVNQPIAGTVGDIQANSASVLTGEIIPGPADLAFDPSILLSRTVSDRTGGHVDTNWMFMKPGISGIATISGAELPGLFDGTPIKFKSENTLWYPLDTVPAAILSLSGNLIPVSRTTSSVCPSFEILEGSGCRSCSKGCVVTLAAKSTCLQGTAVVSIKSGNADLMTTMVFLTVDTLNQTVKLKTNESSLTVDICLTATTVECHQITFDTLEITSGELVNQTGKVEIHTGSEDPSDDSWFMFKWIGDMFKGIGKWWQTLLALLFWGAMLVLLIIGLWLLFPIWWPMLMWCIAKFRGLIRKVGDKIPKSMKMEEKAELPVSEKKDDRSMGKTTQKRRVASFQWER